MEDINYKYRIAYYIKHENVSEKILSQQSVEKIGLLHQTYILLHEETFESKKQGYGSLNALSYARHLTIQRVKNFELLQNEIPIKEDKPHTGILKEDYYQKEFEVIEIAKTWDILIKNIIPVIYFLESNAAGFDSKTQIYGKITQGALQIYELQREFEKHSKLESYVLKGHFINNLRMMILKESIDFLLEKNDGYRFIFYRAEINFISHTEIQKQLIKDFRSNDSLNNREKSILFLNSFYKGLFFETNNKKEPEKNEIINDRFYIHRKLYVVPCPYWKRNTDMPELIATYEPIILENDFKCDRKIKEKLEEENAIFRKYWIDLTNNETRVYETEKGVLKMEHDANNIERWNYYSDEYGYSDIIKGSSILLNGRLMK